MRITIQVTCDTPAEAQDAIARLTRPRTWEDDLVVGGHRPNVNNSTPVRQVSEARLDQIMAGSGAAPPLPSGKDYSKAEPEPEPVPVRVLTPFNTSPGDPTITKIGSKTREHILGELRIQNREPAYFGAKYFEHLKLLWKRGEIKFSGTEYSI